MKNREKTALVLSGGGSCGSYEIGVWAALRKLHISIDIVCGTSVGALNGAMIVMDKFHDAERFWVDVTTDKIFDIDLPARTELSTEKAEDTGGVYLKDRSKKLIKELAENISGRISPDMVNDIYKYTGKDLEQIISRFTAAEHEDADEKKHLSGMSMEEAFGYAKDMLLHGGVGSSRLMDILKGFIDEAYFRSSPVDYCLVTAELPSMKGHFLNKASIPVGKLHDYIIASASCFPAAHYHEIDGVKYVDGGYADNMPVRMAFSMGAQKIIAVDLGQPGRVRYDELKAVGSMVSELNVITPSSSTGNFLSFNADTARRNLRLGEMDTMKTLGRYDGRYMTFKKGAFDTESLREADAAGKVFGLDPFILYSQKKFDRDLNEKVTAAQASYSQLVQRSVSAKKAVRELNGEMLAIFIARNLVSAGTKSPFVNKAAMKLISDYVLTAEYLIRAGMLK